MPDCFLYLGHHKCASVTFMDIFETVMKRAGLTVGMLPKPYYGIGRFMNESGVAAVSVPIVDYKELDDLKAFKAFHVIRDPRDLLVSAYYSHLKTHRTEGWDELPPHRERLQNCSKDEGLMIEMDFSIIPWTFNILSQWNFNDPRILELRYELFINDRNAFLIKAFGFLGVINESIPAGNGSLTTADLEEIIKANTLVQFASGAQCESKESHFRKGKAGDWINHFSTEHKAAFKTKFPGLVSTLGYAENENW